MDQKEDNNFDIFRFDMSCFKYNLLYSLWFVFWLSLKSNLNHNPPWNKSGGISCHCLIWNQKGKFADPILIWHWITEYSTLLTFGFNTGAPPGGLVAHFIHFKHETFRLDHIEVYLSNKVRGARICHF